MNPWAAFAAGCLVGAVGLVAVVVLLFWLLERGASEPGQDEEDFYA